jgi:glutaredoxin
MSLPVIYIDVVFARAACFFCFAAPELLWTARKGVAVETVGMCRLLNAA